MKKNKMLMLVPIVFMVLAFYLFLVFLVNVITDSTSLSNPNTNVIATLIISIFLFLVSIGIFVLLSKVNKENKKYERLEKEGVETKGKIVDFVSAKIGGETMYVPIIQFANKDNKNIQARAKILLNQEAKEYLETLDRVKIKMFDDVCELIEPIDNKKTVSNNQNISQESIEYYNSVKAAMKKDYVESLSKSNETIKIKAMFYFQIAILVCSLLTFVISGIKCLLADKIGPEIAIVMFSGMSSTIFLILVILGARKSIVYKKGVPGRAVNYSIDKHYDTDTGHYDGAIVTIYFFNEYHESKKCKVETFVGLTDMIEELTYLPILIYKNRAVPDIERIQKELIEKNK